MNIRRTLDYKYRLKICYALNIHLRTAANFKLDNGSAAIMATTVNIIGLGTIAFSWNGRLINVRHLRIAYKRQVEVDWHAHTAAISDDRYQYIDPDGSFTFSSLEFGSRTIINYPPPMGVHITSGFLVRHFNKNSKPKK